jgi:hypothetical protein
MFNGRRSLETRFSPVTRHVKTRFLTVIVRAWQPTGIRDLTNI